MKRLFQLLLLLAALSMFTPGCSFFTSPDDSRFGDLQINIRFAGATNSGAAAKSGMLASPQIIDRVVVIVRERSVNQRTGNGPLGRELIRRNFPLSADGQLRAVIQVPLENAGANCFTVGVEVFEGLILLYSGEDPEVCFDEKNRRTQADVLLDPLALDLLNISGNDLPNFERTFTLEVMVKDSTVTDIEISSANVSIRFPVQPFTIFNNPVLLWGDTTLVHVIALRRNRSSVEAMRRIIHTDRKSDMIVALTWDQRVDLDLAITTPLLQVITGSNSIDSVDVQGKIVQEDPDGFGPEVYEWRNGLNLQGTFSVKVRRPVGVAATGRVYVFLREGQKGLQQQLPPVSFQFNAQDRETEKEVIPIQWPN